MSLVQGFKRLARGESNVDVIGRTKTWAIVSAIVIVVSLAGVFGRKLNLGLEFKGGTALTVPLTSSAGVPEIEDKLEPFELGEIQVQITGRAGGSDRQALVRAKRIDPADLGDVREAMAEVTGAPNVGAVNVTDVGPSWGRQVSAKALRGLIVFLILVSIYISTRFELKMAAGALGALFHDLLSTAGIYALVGFEVTPATVVALLTLMGFSLYDTVVVFDRIRENANAVASTGRETYSSMVNRSINEVMMRSINTSLSSLLPVAGLLFVGVFLFGAATLKDLALAMFIGTAVSTYSSIFVAAPILAALKEREPRFRAIRARVGGEPSGRLAMAAAGPAVATDGAETPGGAEGGVRRGAPAIQVPRTAPRPRKRKRGKRR